MTADSPVSAAGLSEKLYASVLDEYRSRIDGARQRRNLVRAITLAVVVGVWQAVGMRMGPLFLPTPRQVWDAAVGLWASGEMGEAIVTSLKVFAIGFSLSIAIGVVLGFAMGRYRLIDTALVPYVDAAYVTPRVALVPLIVIWFGIGEMGQLVIVVLSAVFPILMNTRAGVQGVSRGLMDLSDMYGASRGAEFRKFVVPAALPFIMTGVRLGAGRAVLGLIVAQMFLALSGFGALLVSYGARFRTAEVLATVAHVALLGITVSWLASALERRAARWKETERAFS